MPTATNKLLTADGFVNLAQRAFDADNDAHKVTAYRQVRALLDVYLICKGPTVDLARKRSKIVAKTNGTPMQTFMELVLTPPMARAWAAESVRRALGPYAVQPPQPLPLSLLPQLRQGMAFPADVHQRWRALTGESVHMDGLWAVYASLATGFEWQRILSHVEPDGSVYYRVAACEANGKPLIVADRVLRHAPRDGLELYARQTWFGARCPDRAALRYDLQQLEERLLRSLSTHPRTRVVAVGGQGYRAGGGAIDPPNSLALANSGYLCGSFFNVPCPAEHRRARPHDVETLMDGALAWLARERSKLKLQGSSKSIDNKRFGKLTADVKRFTEAFELAAWQHEGVLYQAPGQPPSMRLAEAYFLSVAPPWFGVRFVWCADAWEQAIAANPTGALSQLHLEGRPVGTALQKLVASDLVLRASNPAP